MFDNITFWKDTAERALVTAAEVALGFLVIGQTGIMTVDWAELASVSAVAAFASFLKSLIASRVGDGSASLVNTKE